MDSRSDFNAIKERVFGELGLYQQVAGLFDGQWLAGGGRRQISVYSPINGEKLADVALGDSEDYDRLMVRAQASFEEWSKIPAPKRGEVVRAIGDRLRAYVETLGLLISLEVGKTPVEGKGEVQEVIDIGDFAVGLSRQLYGNTMASERPNHRLYEQWHPLGVVGVITAFNFPCAPWAWNALIAAVIGNVVVWKPSPDAALTAIAMTNVVNEVLDEGASQNGGEFRTTSGENHWSPQPATLVNPKSGMHPSMKRGCRPCSSWRLTKLEKWVG